MNKSLRRSAALVTISLVAFLVMPLVGHAEAPSAVSWWYRLNQRALTGLPSPDPPQGVPEGGLYVARDAHPQEALAVGGLKFDAASGSSALLELAVAEDYRQQALSAQIVACPSTNSWGNDAAELWENRPQTQCEDTEGETHKVMGTVEGDGSLITWELSDGFEVFGGFWSIVLVPDCRGGEDVGCESGPEGNSPFQVAFEEPDAGSFQVTGEDPSGNRPPPPEDVGELPTGGGGDGTAPPPDGGGSSGGDTGGSTGGFAGSTGGTTGGSTGSTGSTGTGGASPGTGGGPSVATGGAGEEPIDSAAAPTGDTDDGLARTIAIIMLAVFGAGLWLASGFMARRPAIAGFGAPEGDEGPEAGEPGGLGRFVRNRVSGPRGLR